MADYEACGAETQFWLRVRRKDSSEDILALIIGKMLWLILNDRETPSQPPPPPKDPGPRLGFLGRSPGIILAQNTATIPPTACRSTYTYFRGDFEGAGKIDDDHQTFTDADWSDLQSNAQKTNDGALNALSKCKYGDRSIDCQNAVKCQDEAIISTTKVSDIQVTVTQAVSPDCMRRQINFALQQMEIKGQPGSSDLPCFAGNKSFPWLIKTTQGEWDISVRDLTRVIYINEKSKLSHSLSQDASAPETSIVQSTVAAHVKDDLLSISGGPGLTSYPLMGCGDTERTTGSAQEREDERSWLDSTLPAIADLSSWLVRRLAILAILLAIAFAAGVLAPVLVPSFVVPAYAPLVAAILGAGATALIFVRMPETENHILMIETSRYLKNQLMIAELEADNADHEKLDKDQKRIKSFLLDKMQAILKGDFEEYNSRPYDRYSTFAILNLTQFSQDRDLHLASKSVLDYSTAKAALGSNQSRRFLPYRRRMEELKLHYAPYDSVQPPDFEKNLFSQVQGSDHLIYYLLFYSGQNQLPSTRRRVFFDGRERVREFRMVPFSTFQHMIIHASSTLDPDQTAPEKVILDLAIDKTTPYEQTIRHDGAEIYSSGKGWLVSAGGVQAPAKNFAVAKLNLGIAKTFSDNDRGAAVPTILMLTGGTGQTSVDDLLRIEGKRVVYDEKTETYDGNLCVAEGFACGSNLKIPDDMTKCAAKSGQWSFVDSSNCDGYRDQSQRVFIVIRVQPCAGEQGDACQNFGFFEVVSADPKDSFDLFKQAVLNRNPDDSNNRNPASGKGPSAGQPASTYVSLKPGSHRMEMFSSTMLGVDGVLKVNQLPLISGLASGDIINADGNGTVTISRPNLPVIKIDLSDSSHPKRTVH